MPSHRPYRTAPQRQIKVTQADINGAERGNSRTCAIATALASQGYLRPRVDGRKVAFTVNGERFEYFTPPKGQRALLSFDEGKPIQPFTLRLKDGLVRKAGRSGGPDRTQSARHAKGGRAARSGYKGPRTVLKKRRMNGFETIEVRK